MTRVKKRDGSEEDFIREKIVTAIVKTGGKLEPARRIASDIEKKYSSRSTVSTEEIRKDVLDRLMKEDESTYNSWLENEKKKRR
ncbi:MAG: ATP cone domain-containing protein [Candidatus Micrarchaeia archaeon]